MYKTKITSSGIKRNASKKHQIRFVLLPTVGYLAALYNTKTEHTFSFLWLCFELNVEIRYES